MQARTKARTRTEQPANDVVPATSLSRSTALNILARNLHMRMIDKGWSQAELSRRAKIDKDSMSKYCNAVTFPERVNLKKMADALGCLSSDLAPETVERAKDREPDMQLTQLGQDGKSYLRVNMEVPTTLGAEILLLLAKAATPPS